MSLPGFPMVYNTINTSLSCHNGRYEMTKLGRVLTWLFLSSLSPLYLADDCHRPPMTNLAGVSYLHHQSSFLACVSQP